MPVGLGGDVKNENILKTKNLYIFKRMPNLVIMRFLLPRQVTLAARRKKKFSLGGEQMRTPQPPLGGEREGK